MITHRTFPHPSRQSIRLITILLIFLCLETNATVNTYTFSSNVDFYSEIFGGTLVGEATGNSGAASLDDVNFTSQPIGFTFVFNGNSYTTYTLNSNGNITFGAIAPATGNFNPISSTTLYDGAASAFSRNIQGTFTITGSRTNGSPVLTNITNFNGIVIGKPIFGAGIPSGATVVAFDSDAETITISANASGNGSTTITIASGEIRSENILVGSDLVHVIEWKNFKKQTNGNFDCYNFQIWLYKGTNVMEFRYGGFTNGATGATVQVGLRGLTNADFNNRTTGTDWLASTPGLTNSAAMTISSSVVPPSGLIYTFTPPPVPCISASGGTVDPSAASICENGIYTMTASGFSTGLGTSFQWKVANVSGGPYNNVSGGTGATTTEFTTDPLTPGEYYFVMQASCSFCVCSALSNELHLTVNAFPIVRITPDNISMCAGAPPVSLTATGADTYTWFPPDGLSSTTDVMVDASPGVTTTYTVTGTDVNGCTGSGTGIVVINAATTINGITATPPFVCGGIL